MLVACSGGDDSAATEDDAGASETPTEAAGGSTVPVSEVAVGTARVVDASGEMVVVAQPAAGEFVAFSAECTHQGTVVGVQDGLMLKCPNHGSEFDAGNGGAVLKGPAERPLPAVAVAVDGDNLVLG